MSHDGPSSFTDPRSGRSADMHDLGARAASFNAANIVEAAGGGQARN